ncbi:choice-of-anchor M domain-containing protein [Actinomadura sp. 6N118]|uniref:choice-of-anchor M domain-containing protein n=1 Tax=Actinomadura sp. 6N118 TaxID=3375151 RepID=UPI003788318C
MFGARTVVALVATLVALLGTAAPASAAVTLTSGHVDVIDVNYASGNLTVQVRDETTGTAVERSPADVVLQVPAAAKITVPSGSQWSFLGTAGSTVWVLPQNQVSGLLWAGWNANDVATGVFANNQLTFELVSVTGGQFSMYTTSLGNPTVRFHSRSAGPKTQLVSAKAHSHANWAFNTAGTYTVTFKVTGTLAGTTTTKTSGNVSFTFQVLN